jgi:hypothetical protein
MRVRMKRTSPAAEGRRDVPTTDRFTTPWLLVNDVVMIVFQVPELYVVLFFGLTVRGSCGFGGYAAFAGAPPARAIPAAISPATPTAVVRRKLFILSPSSAH